VQKRDHEIRVVYLQIERQNTRESPRQTPQRAAEEREHEEQSDFS